MTSSAVNLLGGREGGREGRREGGRYKGIKIRYEIAISELTRCHSPIHVVR